MAVLGLPWLHPLKELMIAALPATGHSDVGGGSVAGFMLPESRPQKLFIGYPQAYRRIRPVGNRTIFRQLRWVYESGTNGGRRLRLDASGAESVAVSAFSEAALS
jgi:hypothetical protein